MRYLLALMILSSVTFGEDIFKPTGKYATPVVVVSVTPPASPIAPPVRSSVQRFLVGLFFFWHCAINGPINPKITVIHSKSHRLSLRQKICVQRNTSKISVKSLSRSNAPHRSLPPDIRCRVADTLAETTRFERPIPHESVLTRQ